MNTTANALPVLTKHLCSEEVERYRKLYIAVVGGRTYLVTVHKNYEYGEAIYSLSVYGCHNLARWKQGHSDACTTALATTKVNARPLHAARQFLHDTVARLAL